MSSIPEDSNLGRRPLESYGKHFGSNSLLLRQYHAGAFVRALSCAESSLTVITAPKDSDLDAFRDGLPVGGRDGLLEVKVGGRTLCASEVYWAGKPLSSFKYATVSEVVTSLGYPEEGVFALLDKLGLAQLSDSPFGVLSRSERKRLLLIGALCAKNRVVYFDRPFDDIEREWVPALAALIEETASKSYDQYYVVVGVDVVPSLWERSDSVNIEVLGEKRRRASSFGGARSSKNLTAAVAEVRRLLKTNQVIEPTDTGIISRPQTVHSVTSSYKIDEECATEVIVNPSMSHIIGNHEPSEASNQSDSSSFDLNLLRQQAEKLSSDRRFNPSDPVRDLRDASMRSKNKKK